MGNIGPIRVRFEVLPVGRERVEPVTSERPQRQAFPIARRENWLTRTVRSAAAR